MALSTNVREIRPLLYVPDYTSQLFLHFIRQYQLNLWQERKIPARALSAEHSCSHCNLSKCKQALCMTLWSDFIVSVESC